MGRGRPAEAARFSPGNRLSRPQSYADPIETGASMKFEVIKPWALNLVGPDGRILRALYDVQ